MGMPARRIEADPFARRSGSHLRLVTTPAAPAPSRPRVGASSRARLRQEEARARAIFGVFVAVLLCAVALGGARVTLIARAAEASITEGRVQAAIKDQRAVTDKLEVDRSSLSTPSRIADIASVSMDMGEPKSVRYISLQEGPSASGPASTASGSGAGSTVASTDAVGRLFGAVMDLSAGEAQSLLVGDLGLAGSH
jgi:cell division protein FtsL